jgi:dipeptidyl aminopeptidase/acylaminoacyl peptidase
MQSYTSITVKDIATGKEVKLAAPAGARFGQPSWSPDGKQFALENYTATAVELWLGSVTGTLRKIPGVRLNDTIGQSTVWWGGSRELLARTVPAAAGPAPKPPATPVGPNIQESAGQSGPVPTYQDMLKSAYDEKLFDYYCTAQLAVIEAATGKVTPVGQPGIFSTLQPAPDGKHLLAGRIHKPYSYLHPYSQFPHDTEVLDRAGKRVYLVHASPLEDKVPIEGVPTGPRNVSWRPTEPATLLWWEALDDGDPRKAAPFRDRLMTIKAPFTAQPTQVYRSQNRARGLMFGEKGGLAFTSDYERNRRWVQTFRIFLDDPGAEPKLVWSRSQQDRYRNPGMPMMRRLPTGGAVMQQSGDFIFLDGQGATPQGDRPFLDKMNLNTFETERLFRASGKGYESVIGLLAEDGSKFLTSFEDPNTPPNLFVRTRGSDDRKALTSFADPTPQLRKIKRQLVTYKREDGVQLSFTLFLPPDYKEGERRPTILWAYPLEYNDADTAGQIGGSTERYVTLRGASQLFLLLAGYVVLNDATIPIIGDPETVNNTYVEQLVAGAKAAIQKAAEMGVTDPDRVGVSGHSYGGFMTANLLSHTRLFKAGVARSGAYNRTLTPFGFQSERRTFWQAKDTYIKMSPFTYADQIKDPLLLIHGEADNNTGTFPINSERLYQAVRGNGGTVRLVFLPAESHGYGAKESIEHTLWEMVTWFDKYLKVAKP